MIVQCTHACDAIGRHTLLHTSESSTATPIRAVIGARSPYCKITIIARYVISDAKIETRLQAVKCPVPSPLTTSQRSLDCLDFLLLRYFTGRRHGDKATHSQHQHQQKLDFH